MTYYIQTEKPKGKKVVNCVVVAKDVCGLGQGLAQPGQLGARAQPAITGFGGNFSGQNFQQGGLAGTVASQQTDLVALEQFEVHRIQQDVCAVME